MMVLVTGSGSSGKSAFAEEKILSFGEKKRYYMATMIPFDDECRERIRKHRKMRAEKNFTTIECPVDLLGKIPSPGDGSVVLLECLSNLTANEIWREDRTEEDVAEKIFSEISCLKDSVEDLVVVTNEVFSEGCFYDGETIRYMEILGELNRRLAVLADEVFEVYCGIPLCLKGPSEKNIRMGEKGMILITGGAFQGKKEFAETLHVPSDRPLIKDLQDSIRTIIKADIEPEMALMEFLADTCRKYPDAIITCDEMGSGIVPVRKEDRILRELTGTALKYLASRASEVYRVTAGIPVKIKGEKG